MLTKSGHEFMVGAGPESVGIAIDPPGIDNGLTPIPYVELTPDEAEYLGNLLLQNAWQCRMMAANK